MVRSTEAAEPVPDAPVSMKIPGESDELTYSTGNAAGQSGSEAATVAAAVEEQKPASNISLTPAYPKAALLGKKVAQAVKESNHRETQQFPDWLMNAGFLFALIVAGVCLFHSVDYLRQFQATLQGLTASQGVASVKIEALTNGYVAARLMLLSCGVSIGLAFGFLGFGLFLLGARGSISAQGAAGDYHVTLARLSPGVFVITCAALLTGICATQSVPYSITPVGGTGLEQKPAQGTGSISAPIPEAAAPNGSPATGPANDAMALLRSQPLSEDSPQSEKGSSVTGKDAEAGTR